MRRFWGVIVHSFQGTIVGVFHISVSGRNGTGSAIIGDAGRLPLILCAPLLLTIYKDDNYQVTRIFL
jgi:hypothetical protein